MSIHRLYFQQLIQLSESWPRYLKLPPMFLIGDLDALRALRVMRRLGQLVSGHFARTKACKGLAPVLLSYPNLCCVFPSGLSPTAWPFCKKISDESELFNPKQGMAGLVLATASRSFIVYLVSPVVKIEASGGARSELNTKAEYQLCQMLK